MRGGCYKNSWRACKNSVWLTTGVRGSSRLHRVDVLHFGGDGGCASNAFRETGANSWASSRLAACDSGDSRSLQLVLRATRAWHKPLYLQDKEVLKTSELNAGLRKNSELGAKLPLTRPRPVWRVMPPMSKS